MIHVCDYCGNEYQRNSFCKPSCKVLFHRKGAPEKIVKPDPRDAKIEELNKLYQDKLYQEALVTIEKQATELEKRNQPQNAKPTKEELQAKMDAVPPHRESPPEPATATPRYPYGVPYREDGNYKEETIDL